MGGRALVTGAAGFIGSHLVRALLDDGCEVVGLDNLSSGRMENLSDVIDGIEFVEGDITDYDKMCELCAGVDFVVHHAALTSVRESVNVPKEYNKVNIDGTLNLLEGAKRSGVKRFVFASSSAVYGECTTFPQTEAILPAPASPYALTKLAAEYYCGMYFKLFGLETVSLRYFNVYGPKQDPASQYAAVIPIFVSKLIGGESPTIFGTGEQSRDFVFVGDVCRANLAALAAPGSACGKAFNVAGDSCISVNDLYRLIARFVDREDVEAVHGDPQPGDVLKTRGSTALSRKHLGFQPEVALEEGLRRTVEFFAARA